MAVWQKPRCRDFKRNLAAAGGATCRSGCKEVAVALSVRDWASPLVTNRALAFMRRSSYLRFQLLELDLQL
jgi:hypothetical protein